MQRLARQGSSPRRAAPALLAACVALGGVPARAQTAMVNPDPLAPNLQTNPRKPPRFQRTQGRRLAQAGQPATFAPFTLPAPASGAGDTGFDSSNVRKAQPSRSQRRMPRPDRAAAPQTAAPPPPSAVSKAAAR